MRGRRAVGRDLILTWPTSEVNQIVTGKLCSAAVIPVVLTTLACAGGSLGSPIPAVDVDQVVSRIERANPFPTPTRIVFEWSIREPNLRLDGLGVARLEPPARARLDLFLGNGESVLVAALVDDELRVPEGTSLQVVPSPPLLWASLGVFRPGRGVVLLGAEQMDDDRLRLRYRLPDGDELHYEMEGGRLTGVELRDDGSAMHRVALERAGQEELPSEANYRNLASFRELKITVGAVERVDAYPSDIWYP